ncbi:hypothetical protein [Helicobacter sp. T3_23-1056]
MSEYIKSANKSELDSQREIVFEMNSRLCCWDWIIYHLFLLFSCLIVYLAIFLFLEGKDIMLVMFWFLIGIVGIVMYCAPIYHLNNRIYITEQGIGFEKRHYFRMQKKFFRFGEIGLCINALYDMPRFTITSRLNYIFYDINIEMKPMLFGYIRDKNYRHYIFCKIYTKIDIDNIKNMLAIIRKKTEQSLQTQGINISNNELKSTFRYLEREDI